MESTLAGDWLSWGKAYKHETQIREEIDPDKLCSYGIKLLDDSLFRIGKNELIVIGAETGHGKSELALNVARHNAKQGKTVVIYYLEGGYIDAMQRMKWRDITDKYYSTYRHTRADLDYVRWVNNYKQPQIITQIEGEIYQENIEKYKEKLYFFPTDKDFDIERLMVSLMDFNELLTKNLDIDLIIIDHLQYFSLSGKESEIEQTTRILKMVKHITEYYDTPVLLVSHLRKRGKNAGLPTHEDFYGSGNIAKISSTSIMISKATDKEGFAENIFPTYFRVVKSRTGISPNHAFLVNFDLTRRCYEDDYELYKVNSFGEVANECLPENKLPRWARRNE